MRDTESNVVESLSQTIERTTMKIMSPLGAVLGRTVERPVYPSAFNELRVHMLDNTKHNARPLLLHLANCLQHFRGTAAVVSHRKEYSAIGASEKVISAIAAEAELVLVGTAD